MVSHPGIEAGGLANAPITMTGFAVAAAARLESSSSHVISDSDEQPLPPAAIAAVNAQQIRCEAVRATLAHRPQQAKCLKSSIGKQVSGRFQPRQIHVRM